MKGWVQGRQGMCREHTLREGMPMAMTTVSLVKRPR